MEHGRRNDPAQAEEHAVQLELIAKDQNSGNLGSPAVYLAEDGQVVVQGHTLDADTHANLQNFVAGEGAVKIDRSIVEAALHLLRDR